MQTMTRWTDDQMDDLSGKVDGLDNRMGGLEHKVDVLGCKVDGLEQRVGRLEHTVDELRREMHAEFRAVRGEIKSLQVTMIGGFVTMSAAMIGGFAALFSQL